MVTYVKFCNSSPELSFAGRCADLDAIISLRVPGPCGFPVRCADRSGIKEHGCDFLLAVGFGSI